ncbi:MAG: hypothetical protein ACREVE_10505 [Gammaproteobacteria bacterium]
MSARREIASLIADLRTQPPEVLTDMIGQLAAANIWQQQGRPADLSGPETLDLIIQLINESWARDRAAVGVQSRV